MRSSVGSTLMWLRTTNTQYRGLHSEAAFRICSCVCPAPCASKFIFVAWSRTYASFWEHLPVFRGWNDPFHFCWCFGSMRWTSRVAESNFTWKTITEIEWSARARLHRTHSYARTKVGGRHHRWFRLGNELRSCREFLSRLDANLSVLMDFDDEYHK